MDYTLGCVANMRLDGSYDRWKRCDECYADHQNALPTFTTFMAVNSPEEGLEHIDNRLHELTDRKDRRLSEKKRVTFRLGMNREFYMPRQVREMEGLSTRWVTCLKHSSSTKSGKRRKVGKSEAY